jgi:hypothetical protein
VFSGSLLKNLTNLLKSFLPSSKSATFAKIEYSIDYALQS